MSEVKITELPAFNSLPDDDDYLVIVNDDTTKKVTRQNFLGITGIVVGTDDTQTLTNKTLTTPIISSISNTGTLTLPTSTDTLVGKATTDTLTNKTISTGSTIDANVTVTEVLKKVYPVGCIYISTNSTNPNTTFGFGTWSAFGAGRVPVGFDSGQTEFDTDEETGGSNTHTLTTTEMPVHTHTQSSHTHTVLAPYTTAGGGTTTGTGIPPHNSAASGNSWSPSSVSSSTPAIQNAGSGGAHNNLQPYIVVRMWKRTA